MVRTLKCSKSPILTFYELNIYSHLTKSLDYTTEKGKNFLGICPYKKNALDLQVSR